MLEALLRGRRCGCCIVRLHGRIAWLAPQKIRTLSCRHIVHHLAQQRCWLQVLEAAEMPVFCTLRHAQAMRAQGVSASFLSGTY